MSIEESTAVKFVDEDGDVLMAQEGREGILVASPFRAALFTRREDWDAFVADVNTLWEAYER